MTAFRLALLLTVGLPGYGLADPESARSIAMVEVRMAAEAEVLASGCGLRLNQALRDELRNAAAVTGDAEALAGVEEFARTYTLNLLHRHRRAICARALDKFGPQGEQIEGLLFSN